MLDDATKNVRPGATAAAAASRAARRCSASAAEDPKRPAPSNGSIYDSAKAA